MRGFLWPTEFLVFSDFLVAHSHTHSALQLSVGIEGSPRVQLDGAWHRARGVLIDTDTAHSFDCDGRLTAIGWIEGESQLAEQLRGHVLEGLPFALLDDSLCADLRDRLRPAFGKTTGCPQAYQLWRDALGLLAVDVPGDAVCADRIAAVLDYLRTTPPPPPSIEDLTRIAHLSESRLQHLFRDQVGVPVRRYLLWHRYLTALSVLADGASVAYAAHAAGFADSAHLARTAMRMNGFTPTTMPFHMWLTNCR
jgi:AraC-like DNA-binding protein